MLLLSIPGAEVSLKRNLTACVGGSVSISCLLKNKFAIITWSKENDTELSEVPDTDRFTIVPHVQYNGQVVGYLGIKKLQKEDEGTYWCRAFVKTKEYRNKTRLKVVECNEEALVILEIEQKNLTKRFKAFELFGGHETFVVGVDTGIKYTHYCSIVVPGSNKTLSQSSEKGFGYEMISLCTVTYNGVNYTSEVRFEERDNCEIRLPADPMQRY
uniref:Ig-like domain-containing protein n=1 Tax=Syphacia muris TaxID=451379 RepID=A0A0N5ASR0_9BILA